MTLSIRMVQAEAAATRCALKKLAPSGRFQINVLSEAIQAVNRGQRPINLDPYGRFTRACLKGVSLAYGVRLNDLTSTPRLRKRLGRWRYIDEFSFWKRANYQSAVKLAGVDYSSIEARAAVMARISKGA